MGMQLQITRKGALYSCECRSCGATLYTHEWADWDHNDRRDAMQDGTLPCDECFRGSADPETFGPLRSSYAARMTLPGYLDSTDWNYGTNLIALRRAMREMYGA